MVDNLAIRLKPRQNYVNGNVRSETVYSHENIMWPWPLYSQWIRLISSPFTEAATTAAL